MTLSRKEAQEKDLKAIMGKDIGRDNKIFSPEHIQELHSMFFLYADPRQRRVDVRDILMTAKTLGLDTKYELVYKVINELSEQYEGNPLDFETFLKEITNRIVRMNIWIGKSLQRRGKKSQLQFIGHPRQGRAGHG